MQNQLYTLIWTGDDGVEREYRVEGEAVVGRRRGDPTYQVIVSRGGGVFETGVHDASVSRLHARLTPGDDGLLVEDVGTSGRGSTNGTWINEARIPPGGSGIARPGDTVRFGLYTIARVAVSRGGATEIVVKPGESIVIPVSLLPAVASTGGVETADLGGGKAAVYFSDEVDLGTLAGKAVRVEGGRGEKKLNMLLDMRVKLAEARRLLDLQPPRLEEAAVKLAVLVRLSKYRGILEEAAGEGLVSELEAVLDTIRRGSPVRGVERRLQAITGELIEIVDSLRASGV